MAPLKYSPAILAKALLAIAVAVLAVVGCSAGVVGSGRVITETRPVSGVSAVSLGGVGELTIVQGEPESLEIEAEDNIMPHIRTETNAGILDIGEKGGVEPKKPIRFKLTVSRLTKVYSSGAGSVRADKFSSPGLLDLRVNGAGAVEFSQLECASVKVVLAGAGAVKLQGHTRNQDVEISGAANYLAGDLRTQYTKLAISGAGNARVWAMSELDVSISGMGKVDYYGNPTIKQEIAGVGSLHSLGEKARD
jgi:hypothetical protein